MVINGTIFQDSLKLTDWLEIRNPKIGEILDFNNDGGESYFNLLGLLISTPRDFALFLAKHNIRFIDWTPYETFCSIVFNELKRSNIDLSIVLKGFDIEKFSLGTVDGKYVLENIVDGQIIDERVYKDIISGIYIVSGMEQSKQKYDTVYEETIRREKQKELKNKRLRKVKQLYGKSSLVSMLIHTVAKSSYTFETIREMRLMTFLPFTKQIFKISSVNYYQLAMANGAKLKDIKPNDLDVLQLN